MKYYIIHRTKKIAVAFPNQHRDLTLCDEGIILNLENLEYIDGLQIRNNDNLKNLTDEEILKNIRCWNFHKLNKEDIINL